MGVSRNVPILSTPTTHESLHTPRAPTLHLFWDTPICRKRFPGLLVGYAGMGYSGLGFRSFLIFIWKFVKVIVSVRVPEP